MSSRHPLFVLGMPRCRTAWLSVCLSALGVDCSHEGLRDFLTWGGWADELDVRLLRGPAGDADPSLCYHLGDLLARWPDARFIVVTRDDAEGLEAFVRAAPGEQEAAIRAGWSSYLAAFKGACDQLRARGSAAHFIEFEDLNQDATVADVMEFATGERPSSLWVSRMQRLRVTSKVEIPASVVMPAPRPRIEVPSLDAFDVSDLSAAMYQNRDFATVAAWWRTHTGQQLAQAALPPLGVVVSDAKEPLAALWCYESFGVPVAELVFPVTRPELPPRRAAAALCYAVAACIAAAGKGHEPEASFRVFKTFAPRPMVPFLARLGFKNSLTDRTAMTLTLS